MLLVVELFDACTALWYPSSSMRGLDQVHKDEKLRSASVGMQTLAGTFWSCKGMICIFLSCTLMDFATEARQATTERSMTFDISDTFRPDSLFQGCTHLWFPAVFFPDGLHGFEVHWIYIVHHVLEIRLHLFCHCINQERSMPSSQSTQFKH